MSKPLRFAKALALDALKCLGMAILTLTILAVFVGLCYGALTFLGSLVLSVGFPNVMMEPGSKTAMGMLVVYGGALVWIVCWMLWIMAGWVRTQWRQA